MKSITATELQTQLSDERTRNSMVLLDVREPFEHEICHIEGSTHIPMAEIPNRLNELEPEQTIVALCHHGMRSLQVALFLEKNDFTDVINLTGGIDAWAQEIDPQMQRY